MERKSLALLSWFLPEEWVIREYKPDYGIDMSVELFKYTDSSRTKADTLGEVFYGQIKSVQSTEIRTLQVYERANVEKALLDKPTGDPHEIQVLNLQIETGELLTVQTMGTGLPVILFLVCLDTKRVFFLCLNDYIDKVLVPEDPDYTSKTTKTIHIPVRNEITEHPKSVMPLRFYGQRPKLYAAFSKFNYQYNEMHYILDAIKEKPITELAKSPQLEMLLHLIKRVQAFDFWQATEWFPVWQSHDELGSLESLIRKVIAGQILTENDFPSTKFGTNPEPEILQHLFMVAIQTTWHHLKNLNNMYEEICREWHLPTLFGKIMS